MTTDRSSKILLIEDDATVRCSILAYLEDSGFALLEADGGRIGLDTFRSQAPDLVLLDLRMPDLDGLEVLATLVRESPDTPVVVVSGAGVAANAVEALRLGAWDYVTKPIDDLAVILHAIKRALERARLIRKEREYHQRLAQEVRERTAEIEAIKDLMCRQRDLAAALAATSSLDEGLRLCLNAALETSQMDCGGVYLVDAHGALQLAYHQGLSPDFVQAVSHYAPASAHAELLVDQQPLYTHHSQLGVPQTKAERQEGLGALAVLPLCHQGRVVGYMNIASHGIDEVPGYCRPALEAIASQMGSAVARLAAEAALRESELRFRTFFECAPIALGVGTRDGKVLAFNDVMNRLLGYTDSELRQLDLREIYVDRRDREQLVAQLQTAEVVRNCDVRMRRRDGTTFHAIVTIVPFTFGGQDCCLSTLEDVTEQRRAEEKLRSLAQRLAIHVEHTPLGVIEWDLDFRVTQWNRAAEKLFGFAAHEAFGRCGMDLIVPENARVHVQEKWQDLLENREGGIHSTNENITKDGRTRICEWHNTPLVDAEGMVIGVASLVQDITEREHAEKARNSYIRFLEDLERIDRVIRRRTDVQAAMEDVLETVLSVFECDRAWLVYPCDPQALSWRVAMERTRPEFPGPLARDFEHPAAPGFAQFSQKLLDADEPLVFDRSSGGAEWDPPALADVQSFVSMAIRPKVGNNWAFGIHQCAHSRVWPTEERLLFKEIGRRIEDALSNLLFLRDLADSAARLRAVVDQAGDSLWLISLDGKIIDVNQQACDSLGYKRKELLSMAIADIGIHVESPQYKERFWDTLTAGETVTLEGMQRRRDGSTFPVEVRAGLMKLGGESYVLGLARDVTERRQAQEVLEKERQQLISMFDGIGEVIYVADPDSYELLYMNSRGKELFGGGTGEKCYQALQKLDAPCSFCTNDRIFGANEGKPYVWEFQNPPTQCWYRCIDKAIRWPDGRMVRFEMAIDLTDRKRAEEELARLNESLEDKVQERTRELEETQAQLVRKEKLAVLGQLAGGVSHEIRNPLGVIKNAIYYLRLTQQNLDDKGQQHLGLIEREVNTANRIITELLDYAREPRTQPELMELAQCVERALAAVQPEPEIQMQRQFDDVPSSVWADPGQVEQILVNLLRNAVQAMPEGGTLSIRCYTSTDQAIVDVTDTGVGIAPESLAKVFEPLYTNKAKGIGLGLAISKQYAELNQGGLTLAKSELGQGSVFRLALPLHQPDSLSPA